MYLILKKLLYLLLPASLLISACNDSAPPQKIDLTERASLSAIQNQQAPRPLQLCVGSMITPEDGYIYYHKLIQYLSEELGIAVQARDPGNYAEVNRELEDGRTDIAFICGGPYVEGHDQYGLALLAAPVVEGEPAYYSNLIVPATSQARSLEDLRGKTFAFSDPQSNSGYLVPASELARLGSAPDSFFSSSYFSGAHDKSIIAVTDGLVDGSAVDSLIWDFMINRTPELKTKAKVIQRFGPYGIPPVVARKGLDPELQSRIQEILIAMHKIPRGKKILEGMNIERFTIVEDSHYDSIRELSRQLSEAPSPGT